MVYWSTFDRRQLQPLGSNQTTFGRKHHLSQTSMAHPLSAVYWYNKIHTSLILRLACQIYYNLKLSLPTKVKTQVLRLVYLYCVRDCDFMCDCNRVWSMIVGCSSSTMKEERREGERDVGAKWGRRTATRGKARNKRRGVKRWGKATRSQRTVRLDISHTKECCKRGKSI